MDLQQELERDLGHGPALPSPQERLVAGRAALRRRRMSVGAGAVAVLVAIAAPFALSGGGANQGTELPPAAPPSSAQTPVAPTPEPTARPSEDEDPLEVVVVDGVPQMESDLASIVIGPVVRDAERAYGLEIRRDGVRSFVLLLPTPDGGWRVHRLVAAEPGEDLVTWLRDAGWLPTGEEAS